MKFYTFILFVSLFCVSNIVYSQNKKENKTKWTTPVYHNIKGVRGKAALTLIVPTTRISTIIKSDKQDIKGEHVVHDTIIVKGSEVKFVFKFDKRISYLELVGTGRASTPRSRLFSYRR